MSNTPTLTVEDFKAIHLAGQQFEESIPQNVRFLLDQGIKASSLANLLGISRVHVWKVANRKSSLERPKQCFMVNGLAEHLRRQLAA